MAEVKSGETTTEYAETQSAKIWGLVSMILGFVLAYGSEVLSSLGVTPDSKIGVIAGAVIAVAGVLYRALVQLGYVKARSDVKVAASLDTQLGYVKARSDVKVAASLDTKTEE